MIAQGGAPVSYGLDGVRPPEQGRFPVTAFHSVVQDLVLGINAEEVKRTGGPMGIGAGSVGQMIASKWETRLIYSLFNAAARGDASLLTAALEQKADPCSKHTESGVTALHTAALHGSPPEVFKLLVRAGAEIDATDNSKNTPLYLAMNAGKATSAGELIKLGADANKLPSKRDATFAFLASCPKKPTQAHVNLLQRVWMIAPENEGELFDPAKDGPSDGGFFGGGNFASGWGAQEGRGAKERRQNQMRRAVFVCVSNRWVGGLATVLEGRGNPSSCDKKSHRTALEFADAMLDHEMANVLRSYGGWDRSRQDHKDWALCLAAARGDWLAAVHWAHSADYDWREPPPGDRLTAMQYAAVEGHGDIARLLVKAGHTVELLDKRGLSAADLAAERGHVALAGYLSKLERKALESRARALAAKSGGKMEDYLTPLGRAAERVLKPMLMPGAGQEVPWEERDVVELASNKGVDVVDSAALRVTVVNCKGLEAGSFNWSLEAYVKVRVEGEEHRTFDIPDANPTFNTTFDFYVPQPRAVITCTVWDKDVGLWESSGSDDLLGRADIPLLTYLHRLLEGEVVTIQEKLTHQLSGADGSITVKLAFKKLGQ